MNAFEVLDEIEKVGSSNKKKDLLRQNKNNEVLKFLLETSLNPFYKYGVSKFDDGKTYTNKIPSFEAIKQLRADLVSRKITGHAARDKMRNTLLCENKLVRKWLVRAFRRDIKSGIAYGNVDKVFPGLIPKFKVGLCGVYNGEEFDTKYYVEPKYDGFRCVAFVDKDTVVFVSRNNKPLYNVEHIEDELKKICRGTSWVFDGEMLARDWNLTAKIIKKQSEHKDKLTVAFNVFDILTKEEWESKKTKKLKLRKKRMNLITTWKDWKYVKQTPYTLCSDKKCMEEFYQKCVKDGFEGVVLKRKNSKYPFGRSKDWLKYKPYKSFDAKIIGYKEGRGKDAGKLGAFICKYKGEKFRVGSGLNDKLRKLYWKKRGELIGNYVEFECQELTQDGVPRFPVFMRYREDKE